MDWVLTHSITTLLLLAIPALFVVGALQSRGQRGRCFLPVSTPIAALVLVAVLTLAYIAGAQPLALLQLQPLTLVMLALISLLALVIMRFSQRYMDGEANAWRYAQWLQLTLAAVMLVIISNHLALMWLGWVLISLALHNLLMFYPERPRAALGAHKKFLLARLAESCLLVAFVLLYQVHGSAYLSDIVAAYGSAPALTISEQVAMLLIATTALIKCAQLPVHGWLMQVVEAPTPVSALLHAGVINLGGFLLISFAPLLLLAQPAQWLLLLVAGISTVLAALIMATRISVKVRLAWSTSAQMGLMLVECALGLFELALLHLVAHSLYKAYAFLNAGSAVQQYLLQQWLPQRGAHCANWTLAAAISLPLVALAAWWVAPQGPFSPWLLLGLALTVLLARRDQVSLGSWSVLAVVLLAAYSLLKMTSASLLPDYQIHVSLWNDAWVALLVLSLFALRSWLSSSRSEAAQRFNLYLYAGFYLDEWFTRTTLRLWPARIPKRANAKRHVVKPSLTNANNATNAK
ncbi:NADH-quinone oxidoreductase subunit L [Bacterioplanes sanyensis]|uniref:Probable inorganic carbon transporter subunit DabB n=1 Tax=Bacterioplanes sanyensis TaxID=1249553 RepID=A0A222FHJ0_9GAMM|nr:NADH-quinone oxidoreductase subunit L [Bacterioplanes sanyensis]ASP37944.1 NADH-quinone oxidoreductase subunit L [Bacterioplanes sanyensis]